ncbi:MULTISPECIES: ATP-binding protein [unclassified Paraburkholderia]|uniref:BbrUII/HgiDII family restriction enzyme n=1 Tax=unclassified Paraburkholderia TaxID=2615204 RepID=UPI002AAFF730|nr:MULTISPECIES: ATP-binding protein [unclassified Paraburkholderia]
MQNTLNGEIVGKHNFQFNVDVNVINHLGVGLYSSTPAALTELVANAWDADAKNVEITVDPAKRTITIEDDGHGMTAHDIKSKFLKVGYSRRVHSKNKYFSDSGLRRVMGRKGIGKLAIFALADRVEISSQARDSEIVGFEVNVPEFKKSLEDNKPYPLLEFDPKPFKMGHGTRIELQQVLTGLDTTEAFLRVKLARRFSVLDDGNDFNVFLNKKEITKSDRGFYQHVQFLWTFDDASGDAVRQLAKNISNLPLTDEEGAEKVPCIERLPNLVSFGSQEFTVKGYVASVFLPRQLGAKEDSANMLSIFANGRVFAEDVLPEANSAKVYQNYLVGEIHADFLDDDDTDRATASREAIKKDDPKYKALLGFVRTILDSIGPKWDEWRIALGLDGTDPQNAAVLEWIETLADRRDKKAANKLMASIKNAVVHSDPVKNDEAKKVLYRGAIIGFEKLRLRNQLDKLASVTNVLGAEFAAIFATLDQVEESSYAEITRQRLEVIKKFAEISSDPDTLEKVAHKYLFEHLWLLDPTWDRVTGRAEMEKTLTKELKEKHPDSSGARLDISYRASSGRHVVVELKKPTKTSLDFDDLFAQVRKYKRAIEAYYENKEPNKPIPPLDIYLLLAKRPNGFSESDREALAAVNGRIITYEQLINDAKNAYQQYLNVNEETLQLESILKKL